MIETLPNTIFFQVNQWPQVDSHLTAKLYVGHAISNNIDESKLLRLDPDEKLNLNEQDSIILSSTLTSPMTITELFTKSYVDSLHEINRNRRDLSSVFNDQDKEFDNRKLTNLGSLVVNRNPNIDNEVSNKKYVEDSIREGSLLRFNQTLQDYLKVSVEKDTYNLTKYFIKQITDTTEINFPNIGSDLLQKWNIKCKNKNNDSKIGNFIKSTITNSPTGHSGVTPLPSLGNSFIYIENSPSNHGH